MHTCSMSEHVIVILRSGYAVHFTRHEIREMIENPEVYRDADNLPKWLLPQCGFDRDRVNDLLNDLLREGGTVNLI